MTAPATSPPPPPGLPPTAQWNGAQWMDWNGAQWVPAVAVYSQTPPPPPPAVHGQGAPPPATPARATGTFAHLFTQKTGGGGPYWKYNNRPNGTTYWGIVSRPLTGTDVVEQTDGKGNAVARADGNVRWQMDVPFKVMPSPDFTDGVARAGFKSDMRDKLNTAMSFAGAPETVDGGVAGFVPEAGAFIQVTKIGERVIPGWNNAISYEVIYRRPDDPWTIEKTAEIEEAHRQLAANPIQPAGPPPQPIWNGTAWVIPPPTAATAPSAPPVAAPQVPPPAAPPAQVQVPPPAAVAPDAAAIAAYLAAQTAATVTAGPPAAATAPPAQPAALDTPGAPAGTNGQPPPAALAVPPPAGANGAPVQAAGPAPVDAPQITVQQWEAMTAQQRGALEMIVKIPCPPVGSAGQALEVIGGLPRS